jgi:hypothetical protein
VEGAQPRLRLAAHRHVGRLEAEAACGRHRVDRDEAAALAQRAEDELAVPLQLARRRLLAQDVGADEPERAVVGHHPNRHDGTDPLAELVRVQPADRDHAPCPAQLVPAAHVALGRMVEHALRRQEEPDQRGDAADLLPGVVGEVPQLDPVEGVAVEAPVRHARPPEARRSLRERVRGEPEPAGVADRSRDRAGVAAAMAHVLLDAEGQVVVAAERRDLIAREQEHVAVPALLPEPPGRERVVVREQYDIRARPRGRAGDLRDRAGPVRMGRVEMDHRGEVVHSPQLHTS